MRILFLTFQFPYPPDNGARIKTLSILDYLRPRHDVSVLCLTRREPDDEQRRWANAFGDVRWVVLDRGRNPLNLAKSYLSGLPLSIERNRSDEMARLAGETPAMGYDAVFVDGWLMAQYLPEGFAGLKVLHEHNAEYVIWERQARLEGNALRKALVQREAKRVRAYESEILNRFSVVFAVSPQDREALIEIGVDPASTRVLANLPEASLLELPPLSFEASSPVILYFGTLSWQPNIEGLERFITEVFPLVRKDAPQVRLLITGRDAPPGLQNLARATTGVDFLGPANDPEVLYAKARVFVEATRSGGGTKLKILNSLARGLPVVASREAAEGIDVAPGEHLLVADDDQSMADAIVRVTRDGVLWRRLAESGRALVRERYVAEVAFAPLDGVLSGDDRGSSALGAEAVRVLGVRFDNLTRAEAAKRVAELVREDGKGYVVKPYSEFMARAHRDDSFRGILNGAALCLSDGVGILWAAHYLSLPGGRLRALAQFPLSLAAMFLRSSALRRPVREAMHGVDLIWEVLAALDGIGASVYLLGGTAEELAGTRREIEKRLPGLRIVGARDGYFRTEGDENERVIAEVNASKAQVLFVALGSPKQEEWIAENIGRLEANVAVAEGGSFSFISGATRRAPGWMRRAGLEWLFRLLRQPGRIRRQMAVPAFVWLVFRERLGR